MSPNEKKVSDSSDCTHTLRSFSACNGSSPRFSAELVAIFSLEIIEACVVRSKFVSLWVLLIRVLPFLQFIRVTLSIYNYK